MDSTFAMLQPQCDCQGPQSRNSRETGGGRSAVVNDVNYLTSDKARASGGKVDRYRKNFPNITAI
jgi:hypothetical protein